MAIWKFRYWIFYDWALSGRVRNSSMKLTSLAVTSVAMLACSTQEPDLLTVRHFHLQSVDLVDDNAEMARGDQLYRLRGAVTMEERRGRLGHYYTVTWKNDQVGAGDLQVVMDYQQSATASKKLRMAHRIPGEEESGKVEFKIAGEDYRTGGQVLAWRVQLKRGRAVLAEEKSYLWR